MAEQLAGVYTAQKKDGQIYYRSSITYRNKHISLGSFDTAEKAHKAYLCAGQILENTNIAFPDYNAAKILSFEKWVSLINFRDNGIYFATPIYIRPKFFYYYLKPDDFFLFDMDDLFYYSSHKISFRGGHYFVADYGMQVNIKSRYGIKNYAVENRDYRFRNDNNHDYRYENIEIINRYQGVQKKEINNQTLYQVKIHVNGNLNVGTYKTETEAAIAYNKAIDILKNAGIDKEYTANYIEGLSPSTYADIYTSIKIEPGVLHYSPAQ